MIYIHRKNFIKSRKAFEKKFKAGLLPKVSKKEYEALINRFKLYEGKRKYWKTTCRRFKRIYAVGL